MGRSLAFTLVFTLLAPACASAPAQPRASPEPERAATLEAELGAVVERIYASLLIGDRAAWTEIFAEDFVLVDRDGSIKTRPELLEELAPMPAHIELELAVADPIVRDLGDTAVFIYRTREREVIFGQTLDVDYRNTMVFRREPEPAWRLITWQYVEEPRDPTPVPVDPASFDALVGEYMASDEVRYRVERRGDQLFGGRVGKPLSLLIPEAADVFAEPGSEFRKIFVRDERGEVVELIDRRKGTDLRWRPVR